MRKTKAEIAERELKGLVFVQSYYESQAELIRQKITGVRDDMKRVLMELGISRFEDSKKNLWILRRAPGTNEPWYVMYIPVASRLRQNPKFKGD